MRRDEKNQGIIRIGHFKTFAALLGEGVFCLQSSNKDNLI